MKDYKGYSAKITMDEEQGLFHGEVIGISDVITFQGRTPEELTKAFHDSVDDYLAFCKERGEEPDKPYSGRFVVRLSPELHRRISVVAKKAEMSMNEWVVSVLERAAENDPTSAAQPTAKVLGRMRSRFRTTPEASTESPSSPPVEDAAVFAALVTLLTARERGSGQEELLLRKRVAHECFRGMTPEGFEGVVEKFRQASEQFFRESREPLKGSRRRF